LSHPPGLGEHAPHKLHYVKLCLHAEKNGSVAQFVGDFDRIFSGIKLF
jgi:hypothetical protein